MMEASVAAAAVLPSTAGEEQAVAPISMDSTGTTSILSAEVAIALLGAFSNIDGTPSSLTVVSVSVTPSSLSVVSVSVAPAVSVAVFSPSPDVERTSSETDTVSLAGFESVSTSCCGCCWFMEYSNCRSITFIAAKSHGRTPSKPFKILVIASISHRN